MNVERKKKGGLAKESHIKGRREGRKNKEQK